MDFLNHNYLWALPAASALILLLWIYGDFKRRQVLKEYASGGAEVVISYRKRFWRRFLLLSALLMLILTAARPHWGARPLEFNVSESDALVIFDVSKSMLAEDVAPSRLEHGKWLLRELMQKNPDTAFGIVAFAGKAFPACPVTSDRVSLDQCIGELDCSLVPIGGTNLAEALAAAMKMLKASGSAAKEIILITDGEELSGSARKELEELKKTISVCWWLVSVTPQCPL